MKPIRALVWAGCVAWAACLPTGVGAGIDVTVEVEEDVYRFEPADNGAGPMWCAGSTCLVRVGNEVYASGLETIPGAKPLNNCRWVLWRRDAKGWERLAVDEAGRTREPSPLACFPDGTVWLSANPTLVPSDQAGGGPARPEVLRFLAGPDGRVRERMTPVWKGAPRFSEHSYRSFAADAARRELILFQNVDDTHAEWAFRDAEGRWSAQGQLKWPWGGDYARPQPLRVCYPNVALRNREVHFFGVSDIVEPNPAWRAFKKELTGREWDYDFRRLFHTWTPDITREPFRDWHEVAGREATCGWLWPCDLWLASDGAAHVIWAERAIDERLRPKFFPDAKQSQALMHAVLSPRGARRDILLESTEDRPGPVASAARLHVSPDGRVLVIAHLTGGGLDGNRIAELGSGEGSGGWTAIPFRKPFTSYFTATPRAGSASSEVIDLLGIRAGTDNTVSYARVRVSDRSGGGVVGREATPGPSLRVP